MSEGFNPRPRMSLPEPRSVGVASDAEILEFELADWVSPDAILAGLGRQVPEGIRITSLDLVRPTDKARPAAVVYVADPPSPPLRAVWPADLADRIARLLAADRLPVVRHRPTGDKPLDARPFIESVEMDGPFGEAQDRPRVRMVLRTGPKGTVRPDEVLRLLGLDAEAVARADIRRIEIRLG
jgi:radical SAM-linked protein